MPESLTHRLATLAVGGVLDNLSDTLRQSNDEDLAKSLECVEKILTKLESAEDTGWELWKEVKELLTSYGKAGDRVQDLVWTQMVEGWNDEHLLEWLVESGTLSIRIYS